MTTQEEDTGKQMEEISQGNAVYLPIHIKIEVIKLECVT